jgi:methyltransferase (TIGR00027 family)
MEESRASRTALLIAGYRARATRRPGALISDPWAEELGGTEGAELADAVDRLLPDRELWVVVRTAFLDDHVARWVRSEHGGQVVALGAGFDTRAARFARPGVRFFEVDHPATQKEKLARLSRIARYPIDAATYVSCDFEREDFVEKLVAAGFDTSAPALVVWEGVSMYLEEQDIRRTLRRVASLEARSVLLFDHLAKRFVAGTTGGPGDHGAREFVDALGERFRFGTDDALPMLYDEGFRHVRSVTFDAACLSITGTYARERAFRFQHIVLASRTAPPLAHLER